MNFVEQGVLIRAARNPLRFGEHLQRNGQQLLSWCDKNRVALLGELFLPLLVEACENVSGDC